MPESLKIAATILVVGLIGCLIVAAIVDIGSPRMAEERQRKEDQAWNQCFKLDGVPLLDRWGRFSKCEFPTR